MGSARIERQVMLARLFFRNSTDTRPKLVRAPSVTYGYVRETGSGLIGA